MVAQRFYQHANGAFFNLRSVGLFFHCRILSEC
ncbi:MAG: hypothetical protein ACI9PD_001335 [Psychrobacter glaciei]